MEKIGEVKAVQVPTVREYIQAGYPCLYLPTVEAEVAEERVKKAMADLQLTSKTDFGVWKVTSGLMVGKIGSNQMLEKAKDLIDALAYVETAEVPVIAVFHNVRQFIGNFQVIQAMIDAATTARLQGSTLVLVGPHLELPPELKSVVTLVDCPLPTKAAIELEYKKLVKAYADELTLPANKEEAEELISSAATAAVGLDMMGAENALALSFATTEGIDIKLVQAQKEQEVRKSDVLEFVSTDETMENVGGFDEFKKWLTKRKKAFSEEARSYGLPYPKGVLLVGVGGTGKSLLAQAMGAFLGLPILRLDMGKIFRSLVGESLHGDSEIYFSETSKGERVSRMTIRSAFARKQRGYTLSYTDDGAVRWARVLDTIQHQRREKFLRVITRRGLEVVVTEGHSLFIRKSSEGVGSYFGEVKGKPDFEGGKMVPAEARFLKVGDKIAVSRFIRGPRKDRGQTLSVRDVEVKLTKEIACLLGLWLADGSMNGDSIRISCSRKEPEVIQFVRAIGDTCSYQQSGLGVDLTLNGKYMAHLFSFLGVFESGTGAKEKRVPGWVMGMPDEWVASFLKGYFSGDGSFSGHNLEISSVSRNLILDVSLLLRRFRIVPYVKIRPEKEGTGACVGTKASEAYRLVVSKATELEKFLNVIGFIQTEKQEALRGFVRGQEKIRGYSPKKTRYSIIWDEVATIEAFASSDPYSYDLSVDGTEKFVSGGIVVHNSESAMRQALKVAEAVAPVVLWLDEIDKGLAGMKGSGELDSGVTSRVIGTLLTWRQETKAPVVLCGTANDVSAIPSMVFRRGRFDEIWVTDLPAQEEREEIFKIHLRKRGRDSRNFDTEALADQAKDFVGAEIESCIEDAMFSAFSEDMEVETKHILRAIKDTVPQSQRDAEGLKSLREWSATRARSVSGGSKKPEVSGGKVRRIRSKQD